MSSFLVILLSILCCAGLGFSLEAIWGNHDPGGVFPWQFMALIMAAAGAVVGAFGSTAVLLAKWAISSLF